MKELIYERNTHSLNYAERCSANSYSLTINFLELIFDYDTNVLIGVQGFLPLIKAECCDIKLPKSKDGLYQITNINNSKIRQGGIYDYSSVVTTAKFDNNEVQIKYDTKEGFIELDLFPIGKDASFITIDKNLVCSINNTGVLQRLYIIPDQFVG